MLKLTIYAAMFLGWVLPLDAQAGNDSSAAYAGIPSPPAPLARLELVRDEVIAIRTLRFKKGRATQDVVLQLKGGETLGFEADHHDGFMTLEVLDGSGKALTETIIKVGVTAYLDVVNGAAGEFTFRFTGTGPDARPVTLTIGRYSHKYSLGPLSPLP